uniref:PH domain-containing protein n=1 Tax=Macrostomum lignano TaxID=282301 RepID=A0A1I8FGP0_9PLAT
NLRFTLGGSFVAASAAAQNVLRGGSTRALSRSEWQARPRPHAAAHPLLCTRFTLELISGFSILAAAARLTLELNSSSPTTRQRPVRAAVTRKAKSKRQKLWTVLKGQTVYMFKKRSSACNAEYEVNLENLSQLEVQDEPAKDQNKREQQLASAMSMSGGGIKTLALRFDNSKKSVYLTPLDRFDFKRWEEALRRRCSARSGRTKSAAWRAAAACRPGGSPA